MTDSTDALWRVWNNGEGQPPEHEGLDPALVETIRRVQMSDRVPSPSPSRMRAIRDKLTGRNRFVPAVDSTPPSGSPAARPEIRVLVVHSENLFRRGVVAVVSGDEALQVVGEAATAAAGYRLASYHLPDVVLVGTTLPDAPGLAAAKEIRRRLPRLAPIVVAPQKSDQELVEALRANASAYYGTDIDDATLIETIKRVAAGEYVINEQVLDNPYVAAQVLEPFGLATSELAPTSAFAPLTNRELEILKKVSEGASTTEIARTLDISARTVKHHLASIQRKLGVNDRIQAVIVALKRGWITLDRPDGSPGPDDDASASPALVRR
jgi:two-component system response regulator DegU